MSMIRKCFVTASGMSIGRAETGMGERICGLRLGNRAWRLLL